MPRDSDAADQGSVTIPAASTDLLIQQETSLHCNYLPKQNLLSMSLLLALLSIISAKTIIGKYTQNAGTEKSHSGALTKKDIELFRQRIDWPNKDFYVPENILNKWRSLSKTDLYNQWNDNIQNQDDEFKNTFNKALDLNSRNDLEKILDKLKHNAKTELQHLKFLNHHH